MQDIITNFERVADHCSNIAVCLIEVTADSFGAHEYVHDLKEEQAQWYTNALYVLQDKYALPKKEKKKKEPEQC